MFAGVGSRGFSHFFILLTAFKMARIILFNKPFNVLSQFTDDRGRATLADYICAPGYRVAGRLDYDSEGLLLLTADGHLQHAITNPRYKQWKRYLVQVEGEPDDRAMDALCRGISLKDGMTLPALARRIAPPRLWDREPPIRVRKSVADSWLDISICEGRNRQIRRMTAAVGFPTLRLVRMAIGEWSLEQLLPGQYREFTADVSPRPARRQRPSGRR